MFVLCPHCEFLVGVDPRTGLPPAACPKCGQALEAAQVEAAQVEEAPVAEAVAPMEAVPEPAPVADAAPEPEPTPRQLDPEALIAAMAAKPRKSRAKPRTEAKPPKPETPRRKRAERPSPAPKVEAQPEATPARVATPSLTARLATWWASRSKAKPAPTPKPVEPTKEAKPKATVRPIPSLRERAAARAAAKQAKPVPEIEALSISEAPEVEPTVVIEPEARVEPIQAPAIEPEARVEPIETPATEPPAPTPLPPPEIPLPPRPRPTTAPSFLRARSATTPRARWQRIAIVGGLTLLLALQLLLAQRDALAADARWRPTISALCTAFGCAVPAWREPDAFTMLSRDVRPHARAPGTLQIDANFRNDARWAQPWPRLVVSLSDVDGRVVGTRAFTVAEYLGARPTQNTLAPGQSAAIHLAVVEPAPGIVAFSFEFR